MDDVFIGNGGNNMLLEYLTVGLFGTMFVMLAFLMGGAEIFGKNRVFNGLFLLVSAGSFGLLTIPIVSSVVYPDLPGYINYAMLIASVAVPLDWSVHFFNVWRADTVSRQTKKLEAAVALTSKVLKTAEDKLARKIKNKAWKLTIKGCQKKVDVARGEFTVAEKALADFNAELKAKADAAAKAKEAAKAVKAA